MFKNLKESEYWSNKNNLDINIKSVKCNISIDKTLSSKHITNDFLVGSLLFRTNSTPLLTGRVLPLFMVLIQANYFLADT